MTNDGKRRALFLLLLTGIAAVLIGAALSRLEFQAGIPLPGVGDFQIGNPQKEAPKISISIVAMFKIAFVVGLILAAVYTGVKFRKKIPWREILAPAFFTLIFSMIVLSILFTLQGVHINFDVQAPEILMPEPIINPPPLVPVNTNWTWLVWIGLALGLILIGVRLFFWTREPNRISDAVQREAEQAIRALQTGSDIRSVIVRCYRQMSQALQKERGIQLEETMTARDFETLLEARGIPHDPVHQLTQLFEEARYGYRQPGPEEERKAFDCLNAIVQSGLSPRKPD
jgi:protein-S-isoprenylcysteine O-methyltransferase Ste14